MEIDKAGNASVFQSTLTIADAQIANMLMTFAWLLVSIFEPYRGCWAPRNDEVGTNQSYRGDILTP